MRKSLAILMSAFLAAGMVTGCSSSSGTSNDSSAATQAAGSETAGESKESAAAGKTTIKLWHYFSTEGSQEKFQEYVDEFNAQSEKTQVEVTVLPFADFKTQLTVGAAADSLPDIAMLDNCDTVSYAAMGILEDITDQVSGWDSVGKYFDEIMATCKYKDRIYALPLESNNLQIIYNKDMLAEAGVEPPTNFEELVKAAAACTTEDHYGFAISGVQSEESTYQFLPFFWSAGGETMSLDSEAGKRALSMMTDMVNSGSMPKECLTWTQSELASQFTSGTVAMHVMGTWQISNYAKKGVNYGVCEIPKDKVKATVYGGENLAVIKGKNTENALEFMEWFEQYDRISEWDFYIDHFPASEDTLTDERYQTEAWKPFIDMIEYSRARDVTTAWPQISEGYQMAIQKALSGEADVEQALKDGQAMIDEALANAK